MKISGIELEKIIDNLEEDKNGASEEITQLENDLKFHINSEKMELLHQIEIEKKKIEEINQMEVEQKRLMEQQELEKRKLRLRKKAGTVIMLAGRSFSPKKPHSPIHNSSKRKTMTNLDKSSENNNQNGRDEELIKVRKVHPYQVAGIGKVLSFKFIVSRTPFEEVFKWFLERWASMSKKSKAISVRQCYEILADEPIGVTDEEDRLKLARYLIEDLNSNIKFLDWNATSEIPIIRSIFRTLLGNYVVMEPEEEERIKSSIKEIVEKHKTLLKASIRHGLKGETSCSREQLEEIFLENEIPITKQQMDFVERYLFSLSYDLSKLPTQGLFDFIKSDKEKDSCSGSPKQELPAE